MQLDLDNGRFMLVPFRTDLVSSCSSNAPLRCFPQRGAGTGDPLYECGN